MRVIYYAEPIDPNQIPSDKPDQDRLEARYVSLEEYKLMGNIKGHKLIQHGQAVLDGKIYPLNILN